MVSGLPRHGAPGSRRDEEREMAIKIRGGCGGRDGEGLRIEVINFRRSRRFLPDMSGWIILHGKSAGVGKPDSPPTRKGDFPAVTNPFLCWSQPISILTPPT